MRCKVCTQNKPEPEEVKSKMGTIMLRDPESGFFWVKDVCPRCYRNNWASKIRLINNRVKKEIKQKEKISNKIKKEIDFNTCKMCQEVKQRKKISMFKHIDENNRQWHGKICPDCIPAYRGWGAKIFIECKQCTSQFEQKTSNQLFCSNKCSQKFNYLKRRVLRPPRVSKIREQICKTCNIQFFKKQKRVYCSKECKPAKKIYVKKSKEEKPCPTCSKLFFGIKLKKYCRAKCSPSYKKAKLYRRSIERCKLQKISRYYKKEIGEIYYNRPPGYEVDHIHPLKHKLLCGLHVPWNLQYLPAMVNNKKSNKV